MDVPEGFRVVSCDFKGFQECSRGLRGVPGIFTGFQGISRGFRSVPVGFISVPGGVRAVPRDFRCVPGVSNELQRCSR